MVHCQSLYHSTGKAKKVNPLHVLDLEKRGFEILHKKIWWGWLFFLVKGGTGHFCCIRQTVAHVHVRAHTQRCACTAAAGGAERTRVSNEPGWK